MSSLFKFNIKQHISLFSELEKLDENVLAASTLIVESLARTNKVMFCGNGGSASDSQHIAAELTGRFIKDRKPLAALSLTTDTSALTCISNDYSFMEVFSRQVDGLGLAGDTLVAISTSGNSENVIRAVLAAKKIGIKIVGLLGRDGGKLASLCDVSIIVPSNVTARIQEAHILIGHTICGYVEQFLGLVPSENESDL